MELINLGESDQVLNQIPGMIFWCGHSGRVNYGKSRWVWKLLYVQVELSSPISKQLHDRPTSADPLGESTTPSMIIPIAF